MCSFSHVTRCDRPPLCIVRLQSIELKKIISHIELRLQKHTHFIVCFYLYGFVNTKSDIEYHQTHPLFACILTVWTNCVRTEGGCAAGVLFSLRSFLKWATGELKVSVNKKDTRHFQRQAPTRPPEPAVGEYSSVLTKSFWLQCGRSNGLFLWPAGLQRELQWLVWITWAGGLRKYNLFLSDWFNDDHQ